MRHSKTDNPLHALLDRWWLMQQVKQLSLSAIDVAFVEKTIMDCLVEMRETDAAEEVYKMAGRFPSKCLVAVSNKCAAASDDDKRRCTVSICELAAMLLMFQGDNRQKRASAMLLASADEIYTRRGILDEIWTHTSEEDAVRLEDWVREVMERNTEGSGFRFQGSGFRCRDEGEVDYELQHTNMDKQDFLDFIKQQGAVVIDKFVAGDNIEGDKVGVKHEYQAGAQVTNHFHGDGSQVGGEFDIDRFPSSHFSFLRAVNDKERKAEVMKMRQEMIEEVERHEDIKHRKQDLLTYVFEPLMQKERIKHVPSHRVVNDLFGDCMEGVAKEAHSNWKKEMERRYRGLKKRA